MTTFPRALTALAALALLACAALSGRPALAQDMGSMDHAAHMRQMQAGQAAAPGAPVPPVPKEAGQGAFAALQEVVAILEADPATDWSRVDLGALREHMVDMDELTLRARVEEHPTDAGFMAVATGSGRTLEAIRRMVPAHAAMMDGYRGWTVTAAHAALPAPDMGGVVLTVSAPSQAYPAEIAHIQGLGFFGFMASGAHHQVHHLAIAKGEHIHGDH